jgi:hypothetical protein
MVSMLAPSVSGLRELSTSHLELLEAEQSACQLFLIFAMGAGDCDVQSGTSITSRTRDQGTQSAELLLTALGIGKNNLAELQNVPWEEILAVPGAGGLSGEFTPVPDGTVIFPNVGPDAPAVSTVIALIIGEGSRGSRGA